MARKQRTERDGETVEEMVGRWRSLGVAPNRSEKTWTHNLERLRAFVADFGGRDVRDVAAAPEELWRWVDGGHGGNMQALRAFFGDLLRAGLVDANPMSAAMRDRHGATTRRAGVSDEVEALSEPELEQLVAAAARVLGPYGKVVFAPMLRVAAWTGLSMEELFALRPEDVDVAGELIRVRLRVDSRGARSDGKPPTRPARNPRDVVLLDSARRAFEEVGISEAHDTAFAWVAGHTHARVTARDTVKRWKPASVAVNPRYLATVNASSIHYVGHQPPAVASDPLRTVFVTIPPSEDRVEVRARDHGAGRWHPMYLGLPSVVGL